MSLNHCKECGSETDSLSGYCLMCEAIRWSVKHGELKKKEAMRLIS